MKLSSIRAAVITLFLSQVVGVVAPSRAADLRKGVPNEAYLAVYAKHNPERDYQKKYHQEIWDTVKRTKLIERALKIATDRIPEGELAQVKEVIGQITKAAKPIDWKALASAKESVYAQVMAVPSAQHLWLVRVDSAVAKSAHEGFGNLFKLLKGYVDEFVSINTSKAGGAEWTSLTFPGGQVPMELLVGHADNLFFFSTSGDLAKQSLKMLAGDGGTSKFDDPRFVAAFKKLPEAEDMATIFDGRALFKSLDQIGGMIRRLGNNRAEALRAAGIVDALLEELNLMDFEVSVEYTEGNLNRSQSYGKLLPNVDSKAFVQASRAGKPFGKWQSWVPADAISYSLSRGMSLHPVYEKLVSFIKKHVPEAKPMLAEWDAMQDRMGVHLDRDILQAFTGESVSVTFPKTIPTPFGGGDSLSAMRCVKPERIKELLGKLFAMVENEPALKAQGIKLVKSATLEGFQELSVPMLTAVGVQPVIGFKDGWMIFGSSPTAVQKILDTKSGKTASFESSKKFKEFNLKVSGPVDAISYKNIAEQVRGFSQLLRQAGMFAPMITAAAGQDADPKVIEPIKEALALLPSLAEVVSKFDYKQGKISVTQSDSDGNSYHRYTVTVIRPASASK